MKQVWACGGCRSINDPRADRCYRCKTPRAAIEFDKVTLATTPWEAMRPAALPRYRSSRLRAVITSVLILGVLALQVVHGIFWGSVVEQMIAYDELTLQQLDLIVAVDVVSLVIAIAALVTFALWLSRVVAAMPALGLGYTPVTPRAVIFETVIPILNLFRVPPIVRDVMRRLDPDNPRPARMIAAAWLGIVLGILVPRVGAIVLERTHGLTGLSFDDWYRQLIVQYGLAAGLLLVGGIAVIAIVGWVEVRIARLAKEIPAATGGGTPVTGTTEP